jgi:hypothetical protein
MARLLRRIQTDQPQGFSERVVTLFAAYPVRITDHSYRIVPLIHCVLSCACQDVPPLIAASKYYLVNILREELFLVATMVGEIPPLMVRPVMVSCGTRAGRHRVFNAIWSRYPHPCCVVRTNDRIVP